MDSNILYEQRTRMNKMRISRNNKNKQARARKPRFGLAFDVDGVLARGTLALEPAVRMIDLLKNNKGEVAVPMVFVTNALNKDEDKAQQIENWLKVPISPSQMIQAQGPLKVFTQFHDKYCLLIGQGKIFEIAKDLGFTNMCTLEDVIEAYPLLDMVDHDNRDRIAKYGYTEKGMKRIEAIVLMGEPKRWESSLQVLVDILKTDGKPDKAPEAIPEEHLPVIACNMDLEFMDRACMPRYGHGAFLLCLEALYKKVTGKPLKYTSLIGKPSEVTFRYAEHCLTQQARALGITEPLQRMYLVGDTPDADIVGANLYQRYIDRIRHQGDSDVNDNVKSHEDYDHELPESRNVPASAKLHKQTITDIESLLVCTGVYKPETSGTEEGDEKNYRGHRDFAHNPELYKPTKTCADVYDAIEYVLNKEQVVL